MMMFMGLAAMNTQANLLFGVFGLMIGILIVSGIFSRIVLRKLSVRRNLPKHGVVGDPMTVYYEITNNKRFWPSFSIGLAELDGVNEFMKQPQCYMLHAAGKMTATVPLEMIPRRRGLHGLDHFQLSTSFPFGFIKRATVDRHKDVICIFPAIGEVDERVIAMCRAADTTGESARPHAGGMDEFYGLREFRPGDNPRHIYWRRSARTGVLVAREMTRVTPPRLMLLVDTFLPDTTRQTRALVERTIAMAASIASAALEQDLAVGLCVWSGKVLTVSPSRGKQQREELLTLLACLPPNTMFEGKGLFEQAQWNMKPATTLVLLAPREAEMHPVGIARGGMVIFSAEAEAQGDRFRFRPTVRFGGSGKAKSAPSGNPN
jgi:uncharacterized protein (DUF58 family)